VILEVCLAVYCLLAYLIGWRTFIGALSGSPEVAKRVLMFVLSPLIVPVLFVVLAFKSYSQ
jgi:uncharacterized membrane protein YhdT